MNRLILFILIIIFVPVIFFTCEKEPPKLSRAQNKVLDSLAKVRTIVLRKQLDSLCDIQFEEEIDRTTDSIVEIRINMIRKKIEADAKKN